MYLYIAAVAAVERAEISVKGRKSSQAVQGLGKEFQLASINVCVKLTVSKLNSIYVPVASSPSPVFAESRVYYKFYYLEVSRSMKLICTGGLAQEGDLFLSFVNFLDLDYYHDQTIIICLYNDY